MHLSLELAGALARRATRATQANDTSSRSHAVFRICLPGGGVIGLEARVFQVFLRTGLKSDLMPVSGAVLTLVDCAGSERRQDTTQHDSQGQKETWHGGRQYRETVSS